VFAKALSAARVLNSPKKPVMMLILDMLP
jgi:hypothetical protein